MQCHFFNWKLSILIITSFCFIHLPLMAQNKKSVRVFLLGGQSNMLGAGKISNLQAPYDKPFDKVMILNWGKWAVLAPNVKANKPGQFGPEISFGHEIVKVFPGEDIRFVKYAAGGTALYDDWSPVIKGRPYTMFMRNVKEAIADLEKSKAKYEIAGMLWLQGESDAHENKGADYKKNLTDFIAHVRKEFKTPEMPFIIARVRSHYGGKTGQAKIVRDAQVKIAESDKNTGWFDTDDLSMRNAGHYDAAGLIEIGKRFAKKYQELTKRGSK